jgi:hypothetical protein
MKPLFRPPDFWKTAVITLPDNSFFELLRSVFGNIKTPFNKQRLMADLTAFLSREEIQKTIYRYIDAADARIIAAVGVLGEPVQGELDSFFAGELSYIVLHEIILNLEERFILYRFQEDGKNRLALNPVLEPVLAPIAADVSLLFPSRLPVQGVELPAALVPDDRTLGGLLAFIFAEPAFFKNEGGIRKKVLDAGAAIFPGLDLEALTGGFRLLELLREEGEGFVPHEGRLRAFADLSPRERMEYTAAGMYCFLYEEGADAAGRLFRGRIHSLAALIHRLTGLVKPERWYPPETLNRYGGILERELQTERIRGIWFDKLCGLMKTLGLLVSPAPGYWTVPAPAGVGEGGPVLAMDSAFSGILHPGISFADILKLASFFTIREVGVVVRFELSRESAIRGFDQGLDSEKMTALLQRLSQNRISESLVWSLKEWEKRYGEVSLRQGLVLMLAEDRRYLAEAEPVAALVRETLAPGVYLLSSPAAGEALEALRKAGVDIVSRPSEGVFAESRGGLQARGGPESSGAFPPLENAPGAGMEPSVVSGLASGAEGEALKDRFRGVLEKMSLGREEREELASRINRRLVLSDSQLAGASIRYEKLEARLLDYVGKAAIAKQAISSKSPVEITWTHPRKGPVAVMGIPAALEKTGGESILVLNPLSPEGGEALRIPGDTIRIPGDTIRIPGDTIRIPLGKISLLRRIKKSIFGD